MNTTATIVEKSEKDAAYFIDYFEKRLAACKEQDAKGYMIGWDNGLMIRVEGPTCRTIAFEKATVFATAEEALAIMPVRNGAHQMAELYTVAAAQQLTIGILEKCIRQMQEVANG